jgi:hypothetical protein
MKVPFAFLYDYIGQFGKLGFNFEFSQYEYTQHLVKKYNELSILVEIKRKMYIPY